MELELTTFKAMLQADDALDIREIESKYRQTASGEHPAFTHADFNAAYFDKRDGSWTWVNRQVAGAMTGVAMEEYLDGVVVDTCR